MTLILIILKYGAACDHLESNVESLTCIFNFGLGVTLAIKWPILANLNFWRQKFSKSLGEVDVCKEFVTKQNSLRCAVLEYGLKKR